MPDKIAEHAFLSLRITLYHVTPHHVTLHHVTNHPTGGNPMQEMIDRGLSEEQRMMRFKIVKSMFPRTAGIYAGPEN